MQQINLIPMNWLELGLSINTRRIAQFEIHLSNNKKSRVYFQQENMASVAPNNHQTNVSQPRRAKREWTSGLFECCSDCGELIFAYLLPCIYQYRLFNQANEGVCSCCFGGLIPLRTKIRTERNIQGSIFHDCLATYFCGICAMVQMSKEMKNTQSLI